MIIVLLLNTTKEDLIYEKELTKKVSLLARDLALSPLEHELDEIHYLRDYMHLPDQVKWAKDRDVDKLFKLLKAENKVNTIKKSQTET